MKSCSTIVLLGVGATTVTAFQPSSTLLARPTRPRSTPQPLHPLSKSIRSISLLNLSSNDGDGGSNISKRRRRKRKQAADASAPTESTAAPAAQPPVKAEASTTEPPTTRPPPSEKTSAKSLAQQMLQQEQMMYDQDEDLTSFIPQRLEEDDRISAAASKAGFSVNSGASGVSAGNADLEDLFDSREFLQRKREKQMESQLKSKSGGGTSETAIPTKKKIKRSDVKAYTKLLEMDPLADEDDSYFENEGVDVISALLGDVERNLDGSPIVTEGEDGDKAMKKKTSFLGIGSGPLQVGHFIGALGVVLMAFVEYPGFPLTNLPDPLRGALQGGLGTIYLINTVLAVFAATSAPARKQSPLLWGAKTFAVGGIAYDQLMQIPTPEELKERLRKEEEEEERRRLLTRRRSRKN